MPNGYDIVSSSPLSATVQPYNFLGFKEDSIKITAPEDKPWKFDGLLYEIDRLKHFMWMLFVFGSVSTVILVYKIVKNKEAIWKAIFGSRILFSTLFPLFFIMTSIDRIENILNK